jgi:prepilin-type processing-associated H-X9-DG protein
LNQAVVIDDGDSGFSASGWTQNSLTGSYNGDQTFRQGGGTGTATWTFTVQPGQFQVSAFWPHATNRSKQAPYKISGGTGGDVVVTVNQENAPAGGPTESGKVFQNLGSAITISGTTITVTLSSIPSGSYDAGDTTGANSYVIADAVRIECTGAPAGGGGGGGNLAARIINGDKLFTGTADLDHARPSSHHKGGVNFAFCDGRVRFVKETIAYNVYRQLMTPFGDGSDAKDENGVLDPVLDATAIGE